MGDDHTQSVLLMSSLLRHHVLVAVTEENPASHINDLGNGNRVLSGSGGDDLRESAMTLVQNTGRVVVSKIILRPPSFAISSS